MADASLDSLVGILDERDIPYDRDALRAAFQDPKSQTAIQAWMHEYLAPETLLTKDELAQYAALEKSGEASVLASAQDLSLVRGFSDKDIRQAIEELKRSTAAIEKQSETLKLQQNAMSMLVEDNGRTGQARLQANKSQQRKWDTERAKITSAIDGLSQDLRYKSGDLGQQSKTTEMAIRQTVEDILRSDDKLLSSLQKLASDLEPGRPEDESTIERIKELCARLIKYTVEGTRTRLDRIYLESLNNLTESSENVEVKSQEVTDLQEELESLYAEILPVAQMSAEQQFLEPALRDIASRNGHGQERSAKAMKYIQDCLRFLVKRAETFLVYAQEHQCYRMALKFMVAEAKTELLRLEPSADAKDKTATATAERRKSSGSQSPARKRNARRRSSGFADDEIEPEQQLLRNLGIALPSDAAAEGPRIEALRRALSDRVSKLGGHAESLQSTTESSIASHVLDAHVTLQLLRDSLLAYTPYREVSLLDRDVDSSIAALETEVRDLEDMVKEVDLQGLQTRNAHRERLVSRWAR